ncbi:MAG: HTH domain-containing protein [Pseudomonadota bacterium]
MRASRLLRILLILQNRGRQTSAELAQELEVARRTILRDVDAMTEAGLPIIVHQGHGGGIELGFNYRTRLTGLSRDEAEALGLILAAPAPMLAPTGLFTAGERARTKLLESLPDGTRQLAQTAQALFQHHWQDLPAADPRLPAMAQAIRGRHVVRLRAHQTPCEVHPVQLILRDTWAIDCALSGQHIPLEDWGSINISGQTFAIA